MNMFRIAFMFIIFFKFELVLSAQICTNYLNSIQFNINSKDQTTSLSGQIDLPATIEPRGVVLLVPGSGLHDRDVDFGITDSTEELIFKKISEQLTSQGFAVARFDYRGIKCNKKTMPICHNCSEEQIMAHFIKHCVDPNVRKSVSPANIREDIESVYKFAASYAKNKGVEVFTLGHSEGSLHISKLIQENRIQPKGVLFLGGMAESIASTFEWQVSLRLIDAPSSLDINNDGKIDNSEIAIAYKNEPTNLARLSVEDLISPDGYVDLIGLAEEGALSYQYMMNEAMRKNDSDPFRDSDGTIIASYSWWKMFFLDNTSVSDYLSDYMGRVVYLNGDKDVQVDFNRQKNLIDSQDPKSGHPIQLVNVHGTGHALGKDMLYGPMEKASLDLIIKYMEELLAQ